MARSEFPGSGHIWAKPKPEPHVSEGRWQLLNQGPSPSRPALGRRSESLYHGSHLVHSASCLIILKIHGIGWAVLSSLPSLLGPQLGALSASALPCGWFQGKGPWGDNSDPCGVVPSNPSPPAHSMWQNMGSFCQGSHPVPACTTQREPGVLGPAMEGAPSSIWAGVSAAS